MTTLFDHVHRIARLAAAATLVGAGAVSSAAGVEEAVDDSPMKGACPPACPWEGFLNYSYSSVTDGRAPWHDARATVVHPFGGGLTAALELIEGSRFDRWDRAVALDTYAELWAGSYGNLRTQYAASPDFLPLAGVYGELFQGLRDGWEVSANYRFRAYSDDETHLLGVSLGRYVGRWYLRALGHMLPRAGELGVVYTAEARRYFAPPRSYVELEAGRGRGVEVIDVGPVIQMTGTYHASVRLQTYVTNHFGIAVQGVYSDDEFFKRRTIAVGVMSRW